MVRLDATGTIQSVAETLPPNISTMDKSRLLGSTMKESTQEPGDYLDPKVLAKISSLELRARLIVEGLLSGMHHSPHRGLSVEFADHRAYTQGDDLKHVDWKLFGKTDKYYIKEYEQETNLELLLVVDCSESMAYRSSREGMTKHAYATSLAAAISYLTLQQRDSVGLALFDQRVTQFLKPSNRAHQWKTLVQELAGRVGPGKTSVGQVLGELCERLVRPTLVIVISDLFDDDQVVLRGLRQMRYRHHELIVWNVWDEAELTFPFSDWTRFEGLESAGRLLTEPGSLRARYLEEVGRFQSALRQGCGQMQVDYTVFGTAQPLDVVLAGYLATRSGRLRQRSSRVMSRG
ncbi:MAG: DUF58 domain-containing protein [Phycisphaerales bacterium]|nr:MAG: DUF58 domain-containing protein [Phycisphaerales bacterium]